MPRPTGTCWECRKPVLQAVTAAGRTQSLNPDPDPKGNVALYRDATGTWRARVPTPDHPADPWEHIHMPHRATCPGRPRPEPVQTALPIGVTSLAEHRRKKKTR
jgi:hypothetical protein